MAQLLVVVLYKTSHMPGLLNAWQEVGVAGVTILESAGGYRVKNLLQQVGLGALGDLFNSDKLESKTLLAAIEDDEILKKAVTATTKIVGNFNQPKTGILFVMPITMALGITNLENAGQVKTPTVIAEVSPMREADLITRNTPIEIVDKILTIDPIVVEANTPLLEVAEAFIQNPSVNVACVVNKQNQLVGVLPVQNVADDLFMLVVPEEFLLEARGLTDALHFADLTRTKTAGDAMLSPQSVHFNDKVRDVFHKMHDHKLSGVPVVNEGQEIIGYITLLELLALYARSQKNSLEKGEEGDA